MSLYKTKKGTIYLKKQYLIKVDISKNLDETHKDEKSNMILSQLIHSLGISTQNSLGFMCKS